MQSVQILLAVNCQILKKVMQSSGHTDLTSVDGYRCHDLLNHQSEPLTTLPFLPLDTMTHFVMTHYLVCRFKLLLVFDLWLEALNKLSSWTTFKGSPQLVPSNVGKERLDAGSKICKKSLNSKQLCLLTISIKKAPPWLRHLNASNLSILTLVPSTQS